MAINAKTSRTINWKMAMVDLAKKFVLSTIKILQKCVRLHAIHRRIYLRNYYLWIKSTRIWINDFSNETSKIYGKIKYTKKEKGIRKQYGFDIDGYPDAGPPFWLFCLD